MQHHHQIFFFLPFTCTNHVFQMRYKTKVPSLTFDYLSQRSPLIWGVDFYVCGHFSISSVQHFWSSSPRIPQQPQSVFEGAHFLQAFSFKEFPSLVCWCIVIHHDRPQGPTLFQRGRLDFTCVQCNVCSDTGPPVLSPIREEWVMYSKSHTQEDCCRKKAGSGN